MSGTGITFFKFVAFFLSQWQIILLTYRKSAVGFGIFDLFLRGLI